MILPSRLSILAVALMLGCVGTLMGYWKGHSAGADSVLSRITATQYKYSQDTKKVTTEVVTVYKDRIKTVYVKGDTIIKKVPVYVTEKDDSRCVINAGFVRLWNSANQMSVPGSSTGADQTASTVVLSDVAAQHGREAQLCHAKEEQLNRLTEWVVRQSKVH